MSRQNTIEKKVRAILAKDEQSRNDDIRLTQMYWWNYHRDVMQMVDGKPYVALEDLHKLTSQDGIKRVRAKIQNDLKEYLPTNKAVAIKRGMSEVEWRQYLHYPTEDTL